MARGDPERTVEGEGSSSPRERGFLASEFIAREEIPAILAAAKNEGLSIIWVPVAASYFEASPIARYQAALDPSKPLESLEKHQQEKAFVQICKTVQAAVAPERRARSLNQPSGAPLVGRQLPRMPDGRLTLADVNHRLEQGYPSGSDIDDYPFASLLKRLWENDDGYQTHGPLVLEAMNTLLSNQPEKLLKGSVRNGQIMMLTRALAEMTTLSFVSWPSEDMRGLFRIAVLYHDIGKYIMKDRHPSIGWYTMQYIDPEGRDQLKELLAREEYFDLLSVIIRDHDQFGVLSTGEASYPILLRAARSMGSSVDAGIMVLSALMLFNLADMAGVFDVEVETVEKVLGDWRWFKSVLEHCSEERLKLDDYLLEEASRVSHTVQRIQRLIRECSRDFPERREEFSDRKLVMNGLHTVFGNQERINEFAYRFTRICKLDYGKRFFDALIEYCEGPPDGGEKERVLQSHAKQRVKKEDVLYAVLAILKRITNSYAPMIAAGSGNLIGVELKDLTPKGAPEKTTRIIELIVNSHYPGLTWMMSDVPAWYF